jgi:uncharacterized membrane protein HdeD (DUF308 family)
MPPSAAPYFAGLPADAETRRIERALFGIAIAGAVIGIGLGIAMLVWPEATLGVAAFLFGAWLLVHGIVRTIQAIAGFGADTGARVLAGVVGVLFVVAGILCLRNLMTSLAVVVTIIGVTWLIAGIVEIGVAFVAPGSAGHRVWGIAVPGVISILGGIAVLVWPKISLTVLVYFVGIWLILLGAVQLFIVLRAHRALTRAT